MTSKDHTYEGNFVDGMKSGKGKFICKNLGVLVSQEGQY